jgi:hypothetical protein
MKKLITAVLAVCLAGGGQALALRACGSVSFHLVGELSLPFRAHRTG